MGLCNIYQYQRQKTIKLSDAYGVQIRLGNDDKEPLILYECTSVTLPSPKMKTDVVQYGNNSKVFVYPDYSNIGELELEFLEHYSKDNALSIQKFVAVCLHKLFDDTRFEYKLNDFIHELIIKVYSNNFGGCVIEHVFHHLKLTDYTKYDLDYSSAEIAKWSLKFMFMEYFVRRPRETEETGTPEETTPSVNEDQMEAIKAAEEAGAAAAAARQQQLRRGRGVETPAENLEMAEARLENLQKEKAEKGPTKAETKELASIKKQRDELQAQLKTAEEQLEVDKEEHQNRINKHGEAVKNYNEQKTEGTTRKLREKNSELWDAEKLAEENRKLSFEQVKADETKVAELKTKLEALDKRESAINSNISKRLGGEDYNAAIASVEDQVKRFQDDFARAKSSKTLSDDRAASNQDAYWAAQEHNRSDAVKALEADVKRSIVNMDVVDEYMSDSQFAAEQNARKRAQDSLLHDEVMYNFGNDALSEPPVSNNRRPELIELDALENELDLPSTSEVILDNAGISKTTSQIFNFGKEEESGEMKVNPPLATAEQKEQYRKQRQQDRLDSIPKLNFTVPTEEKKEDKPAESPKPKETEEVKKQAEQPKSPMDDFNALTRSERILQKTIEMQKKHPEMRDDIIYEKAAAEVDAELGL